ncbi:MAG: alpha-ribazole phosphatase [Tannerellaceae bacterium]|jgi:alpha-ribazole phosphatase|nr:alpha-ribazole phosphatase [Tannerellaceae bacterium]
MHITLIRHTSVDVPPGVCYGQTDVPLRDSFEQEAAAVAWQLKDEHFDRVYTSPLSRCVRLANRCGYPDALRDERLKELHFGDWEMKSFDQIQDPRLQTWFSDYFNVRTPGGESFRMQLERLSSFFAELKTQPLRHAALFTHGGILTCAQLYTGKVRREVAFSSIHPYGTVLHIEI